MPQLKQLSCCIQWSNTGAPFQEHGTVYGDGVVETFIIVPSKPQLFSIHLTSRGYIAQGLSMIVFIDGNYQCNRTRVNLIPPTKGQPASRTEIDFLLRQKEKPQGDGMYLGRDWRFDNHNIVSEPPAAIQKDHFENLGTIEILVLRCCARSQDEANDEGSSSGEDSDIFKERPSAAEEEVWPARPSPSTTPAVVSSASTMPEPPTQESPGEKLMGLFDGANDPPDPPHFDGGNEGRSGRWIWHQNYAPFSDFPEPPQYHQPEGQRFRSQSYARSPPFAHSDTHHDRRAVSGHVGKRVHFDDGHLENHARTQGASRTSPSLHHPRPQRPPSRLRERRPSNGPQSYPTGAYGPQRFDLPSRKSSWNDTQGNDPKPPSSNSPYYDHPRPDRRHTDRFVSNHQNTAYYPAESDNRVQPQLPQNSPRNGSTHQGDRRHSSSPGENNNWPVSTPQPGLVSFNHGSREWPSSSSWNRSENPLPEKPSSGQNTLPSRAEAEFSSGKTQDPQPWEYHNDPRNHHVAQPFLPVPPYYYFPYHVPIPSQTPHGYEYRQPHHLGFWPTYPPQPYAHSSMYGPSGRQSSVTLHPPPLYPPGLEEHISPTNTVLNNDQGNSIAAEVAQQDPQHQAANGDGYENWDQGTSLPNGGDNEGWNNRKDSSDQDQDASHNSGSDETADKPPSETKTAWESGNVDTNAKANDQNGSGPDNKGNSGTNASDRNNEGHHNSGWDNQGGNLPGVNNSYAWDKPSAGNEALGKADGDQPVVSRTDELVDAPRDLYGPHGPYYALRADRLGGPSPDAEEEPRFDVPKSLAAERGSTKQVQPGPGYLYYKRRIIPEYVDTLESPYARFVFKYRTKDQIQDEIGIQVNVEPTGDSEIQHLQNLDKQELIEMLIRAKGALGGKVPSPPATPSTSAQGSETGAPVAIGAPKQSYLKYSLPPFRPHNASDGKHISSRATSEQKAAETDWNAPVNTNKNNVLNNVDWSATGTWDGPAGAKVRQASGSQQVRQSPQPGAPQSPFAGVSWVKDDGPPPRPDTPPNVPLQPDGVEKGWEQDAKPGWDTSNQGGNDGWW